MADQDGSDRDPVVRVAVHFGNRQDGASPEGYKERYDQEACAALAADLRDYLVKEFAAANWDVQVSSEGNEVTIAHPVGSGLEIQIFSDDVFDVTYRPTGDEVSECLNQNGYMIFADILVAMDEAGMLAISGSFARNGNMKEVLDARNP